MKRVLAIFVKYPSPGSVKTRLAESIGEKKAALLYRTFVETVISRTDCKYFKRVVFYAPPGKGREIEEWLGEELEMYSQRGGDLGERLANAFQLLFKNGAQRVVTIGTDSPLIDKEIVREAFELLKTKQCVIGPSLDGGYYLLGLSKPCKDIFMNIEWGTEKVFLQTLKIIEMLGLPCGILEKHFDVDSLDDLILLKRELGKDSRMNSGDFSALRKAVDEIN